MTDLDISYREEELTELDLENVHLGKASHFSPSTTAHSPPSSKRARSSVERENIYEFGHFANDADGESDADSEESLPKKRRRTSRRIPTVEARSAALKELNSRRTSKKARKTVGDQTKPIKTYGQLQKQENKRRLPVDELVTVSEHPWDSDLEVTGNEFPNVPIGTSH
jgi:hypothetical protein